MSNRTEDYISRQEIYDLVCRYMRGLDRLDRELLLSVFHEDAWCEYGFMNGEPAAFVDYAMQALAGHAANHHMIGNVLIDVQGDEAFGEVYFNAYHKVPGHRASTTSSSPAATWTGTRSATGCGSSAIAASAWTSAVPRRPATATSRSPPTACAAIDLSRAKTIWYILSGHLCD